MSTYVRLRVVTAALCIERLAERKVKSESGTPLFFKSDRQDRERGDGRR